MQDLQEVTQEIHYENYRSEKLAGGGTTPARKITRSVLHLCILSTFIVRSATFNSKCKLSAHLSNIISL